MYTSGGQDHNVMIEEYNKMDEHSDKGKDLRRISTKRGADPKNVDYSRMDGDCTIEGTSRQNSRMDV
jgi:hypothetical protein